MRLKNNVLKRKFLYKSVEVYNSANAKNKKNC